jgi:hypothetical protein
MVDKNIFNKKYYSFTCGIFPSVDLHNEPPCMRSNDLKLGHFEIYNSSVPVPVLFFFSFFNSMLNWFLKL